MFLQPQLVFSYMGDDNDHDDGACRRSLNDDGWMSTLVFKVDAVRDNLVESDQNVKIIVSVNIQLEETVQRTAEIGEVSVSKHVTSSTKLGEYQAIVI